MKIVDAKPFTPNLFQGLTLLQLNDLDRVGGVGFFLCAVDYDLDCPDKQEQPENKAKNPTNNGDKRKNNRKKKKD